MRYKSFLPRNKKARRRVEFMGGASIALFLGLMGISFLGAGLHSVALRSSHVAAVVSALLVELANQDRSAQGVKTLVMNPVLVAAAQAKANDMATKGYFAHVSPDGTEPWHWFEEAGYSFTYAGENLAVDFSDSGDVNTAWMNSPEHRKNILDSHYTEIGIATAQGMYQGRVTTFVVQEFGTPASEKPSAEQDVTPTFTVPEDPATIATAATPSRVLGSASTPGHENAPTSAPTPTSTPTPLPTKQVVAVDRIATTAPALAAQLSQEQVQNPAPWRFVFGFPRDTLRYIYYALGVLVLVALALETGLEIRWHHRRRALYALALIVIMTSLFFIADALFLTRPIVATSLNGATPTLGAPASL